MGLERNILYDEFNLLSGRTLRNATNVKQRGPVFLNVTVTCKFNAMTLDSRSFVLLIDELIFHSIV